MTISAIQTTNLNFGKKKRCFCFLLYFRLLLHNNQRTKKSGDINKWPQWQRYSKYTVHDLKLSHLFPKKTAKKCDNLGTFTQNILFLDCNKTKKGKKCDNLDCDNLRSWTVVYLPLKYVHFLSLLVKYCSEIWMFIR